MLILGHRGASVAFTENTPEAFVGADEMGADGVELDVRITTDGRGSLRLVVHHDPLPPTAAAIAALPDLGSVLDACGARMLVNVEIKNGDVLGPEDPTMAVVAPTIAALRDRGAGWVDRVVISSFSAETVAHCRHVAPEFATALLVSDLQSIDDRLLDEIAAAGHRAVHPWHEAATPELVAAAHARGIAVNVWTVNDPRRLVELERAGVDAVCTDVPDVAGTALGRSGPDLSPRWATPAG